MIELDINASTARASFMPYVVGLAFIPYTDWELKATSIEAVIFYVDSLRIESVAPLVGLLYFFMQQFNVYYLNYMT